MLRDDVPLPVGQVALRDERGAKSPTRVFVSALGDLYDPEPVPEPGPLALRTVTSVVDPPFFGNGDIGRLAVCAAVNALVVAGAEPRRLALAAVVEAGLPTALLHRAAESVREAVGEAGVRVAAVDARVVRAGEVDRLALTATGFGVFTHPPLDPGALRPGDRILVSAPLGSHAVHVLSLRAGLGFEYHVPSDVAPLGGLLEAVHTALPPGALRAAGMVAEGGLAAVLREFAGRSGCAVRVDEAALPVPYGAREAFDVLGLDPLYAAGAGCVCLVVDPAAEATALTALRGRRNGRLATTVGSVTPGPPGTVELRSTEGHMAPLPADRDEDGAPARLL
ncbi:AIR synthase-related protein [Streptomyces herbicida]|uniref:AIR synthase-related protein n=1 Tax=Streptomyces herbicida TaxID=3065675 RepID=UPI00292DD72E|nr:AIR synthase-related protein [Streptomyces sp. NEAU-HV9]